MHFQIYIPGAADLAPELAKVGLGDFVANAEPLRVGEGPDGKAGCVFAWWNWQSRQIGYRPAQQKWSDSREGYWVGLWTESFPLPSELARPYQEAGRKIRLGDGNEWLVPQVEKLPRDMVLADDGTWRYEVQRRHHAVYLESIDWARRFAPTQDGTSQVYVNMAELADFVIGALRMNYRITREVASALRLLSTQTLGAAFSAIVGFDFAVEVASDGE